MDIAITSDSEGSCNFVEPQKINCFQERTAWWPPITKANANMQNILINISDTSCQAASGAWERRGGESERVEITRRTAAKAKASLRIK